MLLMKKESTVRKTVKRQSKFQQTIHKLVRRKTALISMIVLAFMALLAIFGGCFSQDPFETNTANRLAACSGEHWFGTDELGRDMLSRVIYGSGISLTISIASVAIALVFGSILGLGAGYVGGKVDAVLSMVIETICAFPTILLGLIFAVIIGAGSLNVMLAIGISNTPYFARLVRSMALSIREREYVESAIVTGLNHFEIIFRYVVPNLSSVIIVQTSLNAASAIITESALSFMGLGVQAPAASWGSLLRTGYDQISNAPWLSIFPGIAILVTVLALNFFGDGLRDALDVKIRTDA